MQENLKNRTIFCRDNIDVLKGINSECIDLIYLDPPFNTKNIFTAPVGSSAAGASFKDIFKEEDIKEEWLQTIKEDNEKLTSFLTGIKSIDGRKSYNFCYLVYMAIRLIECHRILKDTGSLYLHCDPIMSHYLKIVLDCIFGDNNFNSEIIWRIGWVSGFKTQKQGYIRNHDVILYYTKSKNYMFNKEYIPYASNYLRRDGTKPTGKGIPLEDTWNCHKGDILDSIMIKSFSKEKTGYPTQKPLALLERIIKASSNKKDIVLDPFCGCATTCIAAEKLDRQWIGIDVSVKAYELVKERLKKEISPDLFEQVKEVAFSTDPPHRTDDGKDYYLKKWVYVISNVNDKGYYKVGIAKDWQVRLNSYQTGDPDRAYKLEYKFLTPKFREIEKHIHQKFKNRHEWVEAKLKDIISAIEQYKA